MPNAQLFWPPFQGFPDKSLVIHIFLNTGPPLSSRPVLTRLEGIVEPIVHAHLADKQFNSKRAELTDEGRWVYGIGREWERGYAERAEGLEKDQPKKGQHVRPYVSSKHFFCSCLIVSAS